MKISTANSLEAIYEREHFVQLYDDESALASNLNSFIGGGLKGGDACIVIATPAHIAQLEQMLALARIDVQAAREQHKLVTADATETLAQLMVDNLPDKDRFRQVVGALLTTLPTGGRPPRAFGEMVAILWQQDNQAAAVLLEQLWNELAHTHQFTLFCAYPHHHFAREAHTTALHQISRLHSSLIMPKSIASAEAARPGSEAVAPV